MDVEITKLSSKGQIVIPSGMRKNMKPGEKIFLIKNGDQIIMKRAEDLEDALKEDLEFAMRTEEALQRYEKGLFKEKTREEFLKELEEW